MMVSIKEYCEINNCTFSLIYRKIRNNYPELKEHIEKRDGVIMLDEYAQELLMPKNVIIGKLNERIEELEKENVSLKENQLNTDYFELSSAYNELHEENGKLKLKIKDLEKEQNELLEKLEISNNVKREMENKNNELEQKVQDMMNQLQEKNKKGFFKR